MILWMDQIWLRLHSGCEYVYSLFPGIVFPYIRCPQMDHNRLDLCLQNRLQFEQRYRKNLFCIYFSGEGFFVVLTGIDPDLLFLSPFFRTFFNAVPGLNLMIGSEGKLFCSLCYGGSEARLTVLFVANLLNCWYRIKSRDTFLRFFVKST